MFSHWGHGDSNTIGCSGWLGSCDQAHETGGVGGGGGTGRFGRRRSSQPCPAHTGAGHWSEPQERRGRLMSTSNIWILQRRRGWSVRWAWATVRWSQLDTLAHVQAAAHGVCTAWSLTFYSWWPIFGSQLDVDIKYIMWEKTNHNKKIGEMNMGFIFLGHWNLKCMYLHRETPDSRCCFQDQAQNLQLHTGSSFLQQTGTKTTTMTTR